ncbi:hypothetical protein EJ08DRAFT_395399 [Tothia fuscella]|uniref:Probable treble clef zinc finger domain-containing protein n=1 Tax=Tothia fuscella TaxID=1048955 RepID=A0A9P4NKE2_9PEZI|nr:hypothetical protein EJ08DRAFT_395399 [Tothia fuscella]
MSYYFFHNDRPPPISPPYPITLWAIKTNRDAGLPFNSAHPEMYYGSGAMYPPFPPAMLPPPEIQDSQSVTHEDQLFAYRKKCNATTKKGSSCSKRASDAEDGYLPVCRKHGSVNIRAAYCEGVDDSNTPCRLLVRLDLPYFPRCALHLDDLPYRCSILKLPTELRCQIFSYLIPQHDLSSDQNENTSEIANYSSIVKVCRQFSSEAMHMLFENVNFIFRVDASGLYLLGSPLTRGAGGTLQNAPFAERFPFHLLRKITIDVMHRNSGYVCLFPLTPHFP